MAAVTTHNHSGPQENKVCHCFHIVSPYNFNCVSQFLLHSVFIIIHFQVYPNSLFLRQRLYVVWVVRRQGSQVSMRRTTRESVSRLQKLLHMASDTGSENGERTGPTAQVLLSLCWFPSSQSKSRDKAQAPRGRAVREQAGWCEFRQVEKLHTNLHFCLLLISGRVFCHWSCTPTWYWSADAGGPVRCAPCARGWRGVGPGDQKEYLRPQKSARERKGQVFQGPSPEQSGQRAYKSDTDHTKCTYCSPCTTHCS